MGFPHLQAYVYSRVMSQLPLGPEMMIKIMWYFKWFHCQLTQKITGPSWVVHIDIYIYIYIYLSIHLSIYLYIYICLPEHQNMCGNMVPFFLFIDIYPGFSHPASASLSPVPPGKPSADTKCDLVEHGVVVHVPKSHQPLWNIMEFVSWDDDILNIWKNREKSSKPPEVQLDDIFLLAWSINYPKNIKKYSIDFSHPPKFIPVTLGG